MKVPAAVTKAARAALDKKAAEVVILDLRKQAGFTDFFVLASGANQKQILAIADAVTEAMRAEGLRPKHVEGYPRQEWILLDYSGFVVHVFTPKMRLFYDLERLWGGAQRLEVTAMTAVSARDGRALAAVVAASPAMRELLAVAARLADARTPVLCRARAAPARTSSSTGCTTTGRAATSRW